MLYEIFNFSIHKGNLYLHFSCAFMHFKYTFILPCENPLHFSQHKTKFFLFFLFACNQ